MAEDTSQPLSRNQVWLIAAATLLGGALLFALWFFVIRTPYTPAFTNINSTDAVTITQELDRLKTPYELADDGTTILVPQDQVDSARINILGGELPLKGAVGFELFNNNNIGLTEFAQKINYQRALQGELARTIMALETVENARVHLSLPESGIFEQDRRLAKASITVSTKPGKEIDAPVVRGIQQLVAAAVPELRAANVAILDARGQLLSDVPPETVALPMATPEQNERAIYEQGLAVRIEDAIRAAGIAMPLAVKVTALRSFEDGQTSSEGSAATKGEDTGGQVGPGKRSAPVDVRITLASAPGEAIRQRLMTIARQAIGLDETSGDTVALLVDPALGAVAVPAPKPARAAQGDVLPEASWSAPSFPIWPLVAGGVALLAVLLLWRARQNARAPLPAEARVAFADKLKALLDEDAKNRG